jgi:hypothetical protein
VSCCNSREERDADSRKSEEAPFGIALEESEGIPSVRCADFVDIAM